jgi:hypothetical protein
MIADQVRAINQQLGHAELADVEWHIGTIGEGDTSGDFQGGF